MSDYISDIKSIIEQVNTQFEYNEIRELYNYVYELLTLLYPDFNKEIFVDTMNKLLKPVYKVDYDRNINLINLNDIKIPDDFKKLVDHVNDIANLPQLEQRTPEWFKLREDMITASSSGQALGKCPYNGSKPNDLIIEKVFGREFLDNEYVHHGKKYEEIATKIYEVVYNIQVKEYGLIPHMGNITFLGASPDGIATYKTLNNNFSNMIGRMLEIKCPYSRKIKTKGKIEGVICPTYYYCQVQQQLECCKLEKCDFWQCELLEYEDRNEWFKDDCKSTRNSEDQDKEKYILDTIKKGCIIQLQPKDIEEYDEFKSVYIYPENIDMTCAEYDQWILEKMSSYHESEYYEKYNFDKMLYWKLVKSHNVIINRDKEWFEENLPKLKELWEKVKYYRNNKEEAIKFKNKIQKTPYIKKREVINLVESSDSDYDDDES